MTASVIHQAAATPAKAIALGLLVLAAGIFSPASQAQQQVFRIVGPDGKVTFSDQPPPAASKAKVTATTADSGGAAATAALPFELRKVATQYPVTLYTGDNCGPCTSARAMLSTRGIPFSEKTVTTNEDAQALKRLSGDNSLPFLTIGGQQLKGFSDSEWTQFLDVAGYPKSSVLPASYRQAPATALVTLAPAPVASTTTATPPPPSTPVIPPSSSPSGIRF
ncbi:MAG: glutaredoxin family protein [Polaromonas sp.]|uniref:glutaredoxin family protein n=1 Tax=Polaromonas sp. TaxID=1869339 RepID=UPI00273115D6|nr:glutaredoxin family protein [Polaromonas sp.]MDP1742412.1 glutaredoxin family protein [Polaromonas sp.]MDP1955029.1 glutaredoxin family protein [Polaromonas sp.]MDP3355714.1 glutaredoxin family protein [Polaromonas sp.]MDP3750233.1 glutaredoxin family protein [Polaromonas sp.]